MLTNHHIVPSSRGGRGHSKNIVRLQDSFHARFHSIFENRTPTEQIRELMEINRTALTPEFRKEVADLLASNPCWIYENGIMKRK